MDKSYYIVNNLHIDDEDEENGIAADNADVVKEQTKEVKKMIYSYFSEKENEWRNLAKKYNLDPVTLHQLVNEYGKDKSIEQQWLEGTKNKILSNISEETLEETSDDAIARIVELSKDKK